MPALAGEQHLLQLSRLQIRPQIQIDHIIQEEGHHLLRILRQVLLYKG